MNHEEPEIPGEHKPMLMAFEVPEHASQDIRMMTVWAKALVNFEVEPAHKLAALKWFQSYAKSEIKKEIAKGEKVDQ